MNKNNNNNTNLIIGALLGISVIVIIGGFVYLEYINRNSDSDTVTDYSLDNEESNQEVVQPEFGGRPPGGGQPAQINEAEQEALENRDYSAWLDAFDDINPMSEFITNEDEFLMYVEMQEALMNQDMVTAEKLREELGIPEREERMPPGDTPPDGEIPTEPPEGFNPDEAGEIPVFEDTPSEEV